jgi:ribosomal protein S18 acetylase RimI-like enzyme
VSCSGLTIRRAATGDWDRIMAVMVQWWGGRDLRPMLPKIFFEHFRSTSLVAERDDELVGFLVGFLCHDHAEEAYIHFVGVHPSFRGAGLAQDLYRRFFALAQADGRTVVRALTAPLNKRSIAFHTGMGFAILPGDAEVDGLPVTVDHGPQGDYTVRLELKLDELDEGAR